MIDFDESRFEEVKQRAEHARRKVEDHDEYTSQHSVRVANWALLLASRIPGFDHKRMLRLEITALLHDYGKTFIDPSIIRKEGPLSSAEWAAMRMHPELGTRYLPVPREFVEIGGILWHHRHFNGSGYPESAISGPDLPLEARLIACADVFDALTSIRPYRKEKQCYEPKEAMDMIRELGGTQFDPSIVSIFDSIFKLHCEQVGGLAGRRTMQVLSVVGAEVTRARELLAEMLEGPYDPTEPLRGKAGREGEYLRRLASRLSRANIDPRSAENIASHVLNLPLAETFDPGDIEKAKQSDSSFTRKRHTTDLVLRLRQIPAAFRYMGVVVYQGQLWLSVLERGMEGDFEVCLTR